MKRWLTTFLAVLFCSAALRADVTLVQTTTIEGALAQMAAQAGNSVSPTLTTRVKGMKSRTDVEVGPVRVATIIDLAARQIITLQLESKTATVTSTASGTPATAPQPPEISLPKLDATVSPTGKSQVIDGNKCDEFTFTTTMDMAAMTGRQMPPQAAEMMRGMRFVMTGSMWVTKDGPGAGEYLAFQKSMASSDLVAAVAARAGVAIPGMESMMKATSKLDGMAYLMDMTMNVEGTGQIADMMKQMGPMKITTRVSSINTDAIADDLFKIPEGFTITKQ